MDLTAQQDVIKLMESSKSEKEWNENADKVIAANGGYPNWWYSTIVISGIARKTSLTW